MSTHLIHSQELEILIADKSQAREAQDRISTMNQSDWLPIISQTLDRLYSSEDWFRVDRIEIDVGTLQHNSPAILERRLQESLITCLKVAERENRIHPIKADKGSQTEMYHELNGDIDDPILFYLRTGSIKWSSNTSFDLSENLRARFLLRNNLAPIRKLYAEIGAPVLSRVANALKWKDIEIILKNVIDQSNQNWGHWIKNLKDSSKLILRSQSISLNTSLYQKVCLVTALRLILQGRDSGKSEVPVQRKILRIEITKKILLAHAFDFPKVNTREITGLSESLKTTGLKSESISSILDQDQGSKADESELVQEYNLPAQPIPLEGLLCNNAGISLIWPYLPAFFKAHGWVTNKKFNSQESIAEAAQCLHYMTTGRSLDDESEATTYKLLCGLNFSDHIDLNHKLWKSTKENANELLENVIQNWKALKGTSIVGLREGWLQRRGRLKAEQNGYVIEMETSAIDVLLDKVTWPISTIMLPWNKKMIHVKWK